MKSLCFRTYFSTYLTEKSLSRIYAIGPNLFHLHLSKCSIRSLPPNLFYFIPNLQTAGIAKKELNNGLMDFFY